MYLHITSTSKEGLQKAIDKVNELLHSELPPLVDERRFRRREREEQPQVERDEYGRVRVFLLFGSLFTYHDVTHIASVVH